MGSIDDITPEEWDSMNKVMQDIVNHPPHYNQGNIETIDYIEDVLGEWDTTAYFQGNALKYVSRMFAKGKPIEDAKKAVWYLNKLIKLLEETEGVNW